MSNGCSPDSRTILLVPGPFQGDPSASVKHRYKHRVKADRLTPAYLSQGLRKAMVPTVWLRRKGPPTGAALPALGKAVPAAKAEPQMSTKEKNIKKTQGKLAATTEGAAV